MTAGQENGALWRAHGNFPVELATPLVNLQTN
jgi:hypothetical protein